MKTTLGLELATDPRWVELVQKDLSFILSDHAWCEQKAASTGISLISKFSDFPKLVDKVSPVVAEEWGHFRLVLKELQSRGLQLQFQRKDDYVNKLRSFIRKGGSRTGQLTEYLLMMAMIEARSCERFRMLSLHLEEEELKTFYHSFVISEAGHYKLFIDLAKEVDESGQVMHRWQEWIDFEAHMIRELSLRPDRVH